MNLKKKKKIFRGGGGEVSFNKNSLTSLKVDSSGSFGPAKKKIKNK